MDQKKKSKLQQKELNQKELNQKTPMTTTPGQVTTVAQNQNPQNQNQKRKSFLPTLQEIIQRGNIFYLIGRTEDESREVYLQRVDYIINKMTDDPSKNIEDVKRLSYIWRNVHFHKAGYPASIMRQL